MITAAKIRTVAAVCAMMLSVGGLVPVGQAFATPVIKDFSSRGGSPRNKRGPRDRMYLVRPGDKITFSVKAQDARKYVWQVNKELQKAKTDTFTWTVPREKGIWEIHLTTGNKDAKAHQEWVVSTLSKTEAPAFFEYFADGKYSDRRETDPWGRPMKEWKVEEKRYNPPNVERCWMEPGKGGQKAHTLRAPSKTAYGTWRFLFKFPMGYFIPPNGGSGPRTQIYYTFIRDKEGSRGHEYKYNKVADSHNYFFVRCVPRFGYRMGMSVDSGFKHGRGWYVVTIIRTPDGGLYTYITDIQKNKTYLQFRGHSKAGDTSTFLRMSLNRPLWDMFPRVTVYVDGLEIYKDKYLFPPKSAAYGRYIENWRWKPEPVVDPANTYLEDEWKDYRMRQYTQAEINTINKRHHGHRVSARRIKEWKGRELRWMRGKRNYHPVYGKGIVVQGAGVTPEDINRMVKNPSKFKYDAAKKAWICYTDLVVDEGAELIIKDTTLRMHCARPGEHKIAVMYGATVKIENSTITSDTPNYYLWRFTGAANYGYNLGMETGGLNALSYGSFGAFLVEDSTIDNCAYMFIDAPREVRLRNVNLTNLHQADAGEYSAGPGSEVEKRKKFVKGPKAFCLFIKNFNTSLFDLQGIKFSAAKSPVDITFRLFSDRDRLNICNCDFGNENVVVKPSVKMMSFWNSRWPEYYNSVLGMVNCRFKSISIPEERAFAVPRYYLDVKVVRAGKAVSGEKVKATCEATGSKYPPENMVTKYVCFNKDPRLCVVAIKMGQPISTTKTTRTGHTPLPSDKAATLILPDFVQDKAGRKEFTYTITVEAGGKKKIITGVNPGPHWYRSDPNKPAYTITAILDGKTVTEAELKKKHPAGSP